MDSYYLDSSLFPMNSLHIYVEGIKLKKEATKRSKEER